jgi:hypothetical protein
MTKVCLGIHGVCQRAEKKMRRDIDSQEAFFHVKGNKGQTQVVGLPSIANHLVISGSPSGTHQVKAKR